MNAGRRTQEAGPPRSVRSLALGILIRVARDGAHAAVGETVDAVKAAAPRASGLVNAVLRRVAAREGKGGRLQLPRDTGHAARLALETSHPEWLVDRWIAAYGEEAASAALRADQTDSPVDLLADSRAGSFEEIRARLAADGVATEPSPFAPLALTVVSGDAVGHELVRGGKLPVVDAAAQGTVELVRASPLVVDLAAAPGGKTRTLLARGLARRVVAVERNATRATRLARALTASGRRAEVQVVRA
ncbi:MAG TPA: hypothetical protein VKF32_11830, partial [Thermoanaerobaculia bacterium]|nr:hypothetical protein [Thermoanaerobaculia bacterium]